MSITNSLYIGISGLMAHGDAISTVGDNIANTSTIGFKRSRASFNDLLGGELANQRVGGGVFLGHNQTIWEQGAVAQTGNLMDVAINGGGMFVVKGNHGGLDGQFYMCDGRFQLDNSGYVVDLHGMRLQGYPIQNGTRSNNIGDLPLGARQSPQFVISAIAKQFADVARGRADRIKVGTTSVVRDFLDVRDVVTAYLHGDLDVEIFVRLPEGISAPSSLVRPGVRLTSLTLRSMAIRKTVVSASYH